MTMKTLVALALLATSCSAFAASCPELETQAETMGDHIPSHESGRLTIGTERVAFYSGPDDACKEEGVFVLPGEELNAYINYGDFTSILYINPKNGNEATGWVKTSRLKETGYGIGPN
jgi:hypothetical protein